MEMHPHFNRSQCNIDEQEANAWNNDIDIEYLKRFRVLYKLLRKGQ
jgi:hypothetical protein